MGKITQYFERTCILFAMRKFYYYFRSVILKNQNMGLLKQLLKNALGDAVSEVKKNIYQQQQSQHSTQSQPTPSQSVTPEPKHVPQDGNTYFRDILRTEFALYNVKENVPVTDLVGFANDEFKLYEDRPTQAYKAEWGKPYTFVLEQMGVIKGVVMLGNGNSHSSNVKYLISRMYAKKLGVPYINFYTQMPNEREYVIGRIRKFLY